MAMGIRWVRRPKARLWPRSWKPTVRITIIFFRFVQLSAAGQSFQSPKKKENLQAHAVVHTLATSKILILSLYALVWKGG